jgi:hypothetical protein
MAILPEALIACMIGAMAQKNPAAVALGRLGGQAKVPKGFSALSDEDRKENAKKAAEARWGVKKGTKVKKKKAKP